MSSNKLEQEYINLIQNPIPDVSIKITNNFHVWKAYINGPDNTPYKGGKFEVEIRFPKEYPNKSPDIKFNTKIFHTNISEEGFIFLPLLYEWSSDLKVSDILMAIINILKKPDLIITCHGSFMRHREYEEKAKYWTQRFAGENSQEAEQYIKSDSDSGKKKINKDNVSN
jgi:ubiquitin-protein ligase